MVKYITIRYAFIFLKYKENSTKDLPQALLFWATVYSFIYLFTGFRVLLYLYPYPRNTRILWSTYSLNILQLFK